MAWKACSFPARHKKRSWRFRVCSYEPSMSVLISESWAQEVEFWLKKHKFPVVLLSCWKLWAIYSRQEKVIDFESLVLSQSNM